jgi:hypothetical protein
MEDRSHQCSARIGIRVCASDKCGGLYPYVRVCSLVFPGLFGPLRSIGALRRHTVRKVTGKNRYAGSNRYLKSNGYTGSYTCKE